MNPDRRSPLAALRALTLMLLLAGPLACQVDLGQKAADARTEMDAGRFDAAIAIVDETLAEAGADAPVAKRWALERIRIEALARAGRGEKVAAALEELAGRFEAQATAQLYLSTAQQVREAGDTSGALLVLNKGDLRYPDDADLDAAIEEFKSLAEGDEDLENKLESLGYL